MSDLLELIEPESELLDFHGMRFDHTHAEAHRQAVDAASMSADFIILTTKPNYHGNAHQITESKLGKGMQTERHERNPVVLLEHGFGGIPFPAIGMSKDKQGKYTVKKQKSKATATVFFSQSNPDAATVFAMVDEGVLHMASIGFDALKGVPMKQDKPTQLPEGVMDLTWQCRGVVFTETQLVEWSIVSQGADPGAVRQYLDRGSINGEKLTDRMRAYLQAVAPKVAWTPGANWQTDLLLQQKTEIQELKTERERLRRELVEKQSDLNAERPKKDRGVLNRDLVGRQSDLDSQTPNNTLPSVPTSTDGQGSSGTVHSSPLPVVDLGGEFLKRETQRQQQESQQQFFQGLEKSIEGMLEKKIGELADGQKRIEDELKRRTGVID